MANLDADDDLFGKELRLVDVARLLGATHTLRSVPRDSLEAHEMLLRGLPTKALTYL